MKVADKLKLKREIEFLLQFKIIGSKELRQFRGNLAEKLLKTTTAHHWRNEDYQNRFPLLLNTYLGLFFFFMFFLAEQFTLAPSLCKLVSLYNNNNIHNQKNYNFLACDWF